MKNLKESEIIEFKKSTGEWKEIIEAILAFTNTNNGKICINVSDSDSIEGIKIGKRTIEDLAIKIINNTKSKIYTQI